MSLFIEIISLYNSIECIPYHWRNWWLRWELGIVTRSYWNVENVTGSYATYDTPSFLISKKSSKSTIHPKMCYFRARVNKKLLINFITGRSWLFSLCCEEDISSSLRITPWIVDWYEVPSILAKTGHFLATNCIVLDDVAEVVKCQKSTCEELQHMCSFSHAKLNELTH